MLRLYDFECKECGKKFESICHPEELVLCPNCYSDADRLPPVVRINMGVGAYGYFDETLGKYIGTNREHREECIRQNVTPKGDTPKPHDMHEKDLPTL